MSRRQTVAMGRNEALDEVARRHGWAEAASIPARADRTVFGDAYVPDLAGEARRPVVERSAADDGASYARRELHIDEVREGASGTPAELGQRRGVRVVVHIHRQSCQFLERPPRSSVRPWRDDLRRDSVLREVERTGRLKPAPIRRSRRIPLPRITSSATAPAAAKASWIGVVGRSSCIESSARTSSERSATAARTLSRPKATASTAPATELNRGRFGGRPRPEPRSSFASGSSMTSPSVRSVATTVDTVARERPVLLSSSARLTSPFLWRTPMTRVRLSPRPAIFRRARDPVQTSSPQCPGRHVDRRRSVLPIARARAPTSTARSRRSPAATATASADAGSAYRSMASRIPETSG